MKKTLYTFSLLACGLWSAQKNVEVRASYGAPSLFGISESITGSVINVVFGSPAVDYDSNGVLAIEVMLHNESKKWQYGLGYNNESVTDDRNNIKGTFNTFLAQANYTWTNPENKFRLYSGAGVGVMMTSYDYNITDYKETIFAFNVSPIGVRYGQKLGVFLETNVGTKGLLQGGVSYIF